jgi:hypothetical protein
MVAALIFLNDELAFLALPIVQVTLKELHFLAFAFAPVNSE